MPPSSEIGQKARAEHTSYIQERLCWGKSTKRDLGGAHKKGGAHHKGRWCPKKMCSQEEGDPESMQSEPEDLKKSIIKNTNNGRKGETRNGWADP